MDNYTCLSSLNINNPSREGFGCIHTLEVDNHFQYTLCDLENLSGANQEIVSSQKAEPRVRPEQISSHWNGASFLGGFPSGARINTPYTKEYSACAPYQL